MLLLQTPVKIRKGKKINVFKSAFNKVPGYINFWLDACFFFLLFLLRTWDWILSCFLCFKLIKF